jgi:excisionase family DNA binding protein
MAKLEALAELLLGKNPQGGYKFRKIPRNALPSLPHSNAALVRANEVLDYLFIPEYGCSRSSHFQLGAVVLNTKKQPRSNQNTSVLHPFPAIGDFEKLLDSDEAASLLGIHKKTLQRMARTGEIPGFQIGDLWRFRASTLNDWLASKLAS